MGNIVFGIHIWVMRYWHPLTVFHYLCIVVSIHTIQSTYWRVVSTLSGGCPCHSQNIQNQNCAMFWRPLIGSATDTNRHYEVYELWKRKQLARVLERIITLLLLTRKLQDTIQRPAGIEKNIKKYCFVTLRSYLQHKRYFRENIFLETWFDIIFDLKQGGLVCCYCKKINFGVYTSSSEEIKGNQGTFCTAMQTVQFTVISQIQGI